MPGRLRRLLGQHENDQNKLTKSPPNRELPPMIDSKPIRPRPRSLPSTSAVPQHPAVRPLSNGSLEARGPYQHDMEQPFIPGRVSIVRPRSEHLVDYEHVPDRNSSVGFKIPRRSLPVANRGNDMDSEPPPIKTKPIGSSSRSPSPHSLRKASLSSRDTGSAYSTAKEDVTSRHRQSDLTLESFDRTEAHPDHYFDHTVHTREPVTHEEIKPHEHTIYTVKRTRSIHIHEHKTLIQPIVDPNPTILPEQHWAQDHETGEIFKIPDELGRQLDALNINHQG